MKIKIVLAGMMMFAFALGSYAQDGGTTPDGRRTY